VADVVETLLNNRGIKDEDRASFLNPDWETGTHDPFLFTRMQEAVDRLFLALEQGEKIVIHGDYDADGMSGATLLFTAITEVAEKLNFKLDLSVFLPDREKDGYGVAKHTVEKFIANGVQLIVTVDCGIANADEFDLAKDAGIDVIICDHHQLGVRLPTHAYIIHPLAPGETYPNKHLCGTGVAFKFVSALIIEARKRGADLPEGYEKWFLDLVAIATVTDVMPLHGENRVLEKFGLKVLNKTRRLGIQQIMHFAGSEQGQVDTQTIGFQIGPRINAAGRIKHASVGFNALSATNIIDAEKFAGELELLNRDRQTISRAAAAEAKKMVEDRKSSEPILVVWNDSWNPGIVGLVAGKLVSTFGVPAFALTKVGDKYVGSGRSVGGLNLVEAMRSCGDIFIKAGGHPQACGLSIESEELLKEFQTKVVKYGKEYFGAEAPKPVTDIDFVLPLEKMTRELFTDLQKLEPYGEGNKPPVFVAQNLKVLIAETIGKTKTHLRLSVTTPNGKTAKMVGFSLGDFASELNAGDMVDVAYEIVENEWNGNITLEGRVVDIKVL